MTTAERRTAERPTAGTPRLLRAINDRAALEALIAEGPLSRARLGELTGLSKPTAAQVLARLEAAGLVVAAGTRAGGPGPNARLYQVGPGAGHVAGLDVTRTEVRVAVAGITGSTLAERRFPTKGWTAARTVARTAEAVAATVRAAGLAPGALREVVVGIGGALDPATGRLRYAAHLPGWHSPRLVAELRTAVGAPVSVENDVNLAAVAERTLGAARGHDDFILLWAGTGVGAAVVVGGRTLRGATGGAGEVGYMPLPGAPVVRQVRRRNSGGFQHLAGASAVLALARRHGLTARTAARAVAEATRTPGPGDAFLAGLAGRLALGLASIVAVVDPGLLVLAGEIPAAGGERLRGAVQDALHELTIARPEVRSGTVPGSPVLHGALHRALDTARNALFSTL
ncbi:ROK family transcriptional regulator [Streptomyces caatingaensis]|uniref:ROK family transcriptional regulator n=1 Tax=Streptomyces caatingaensis TaxID=1678637 RepID=A0A0K9XKX7_9ACTN|nr:ROK family transcriptional regulator [Streptomyces caatingaensis]KNB54000.1 ROK family transcriptional regulator [Streptomyces caatingaensis]